MSTPAHKNNTLEFSELTFAEQAKSITAMLNNVQRAIEHHVKHASDPQQTFQKCCDQVDRLRNRL